MVALAAVSLPYLWILFDLWSGSVNLLRQVSPSNFYDLQARALLSGHLYVPKGSLGIEAFVRGNHQYTYFGLFPSLLRLPVLAVTHRFDGRLTALSLLLAWVVTGVATAMLLWRVRMVLRGNAVLGWAEAVSSGVLAAAVTGGSVLLYLAASPKVTHEDVAWSVALTLASAFCLLGVVERPSWGRVVTSGILVLCTALNRSPTGYACILGAVLIAVWFAVGGDRSTNRRWVLPLLVVGGVALVANGLMNWAKLGAPFGLSEADQVWTHVNAHRRAYLSANGGSAFGLRFLPSTLLAYLQPVGIHVGSTFPFLSLPSTPARAVGHVVLDEVYPTASIPASMPLAFLLAAWGVITAFRPRASGKIGGVRALLVALAAATVAVLCFGYIADRYLADFLPFVALAAMVGLVDVWRRMEGRSHRTRVAAVVVVLVLGVFGVWANIGAAITPTALWTSAQAKQFVTTQRSLGGTPTVQSGDRLPYFAPQGTLFAAADCSGLYLATGYSYATVPGQQLQHESWLPVEQGPGINHVIQLVFNRPVSLSDPPIRLLTYGQSTLVAEPTGTNRVRLVLEHPGTPASEWPPADSSSLSVTPHTLYPIEVTTDPNLQALTVAGLGGGIEHYLPGNGPAAVVTQDTAAATVTQVPRPAPSMALCRTLVGDGGVGH